MYSLVLLGGLNPSVPSQPFEKASAVGGSQLCSGQGHTVLPPSPGKGGGARMAQLFSKRERRSSLLLLGRSGGPR